MANSRFPANLRAMQRQHPLVVISVLLAALAISCLTLGLTRAPAGATHRQSGCTFNIPEPVVVTGHAAFDVKVRCSTRQPSRTIEVYLMADDVSYDDALAWARVNVGSARPYMVSRFGLGCNEDRGRDELYLRVRITGHDWLSGPRVRAYCE